MATTNAPKPIRTMTKGEWFAEGERLFGPDVMKWRFRCPCCDHVASVQDYQDAAAPEGTVAYSCIGRYAGLNREAFDQGVGPCNYAGGGLIGMHRLEVIEIPRIGRPCFEFADPMEAAGA